ncbi:hypothetical protein EPUL_003298, partial [Erysiphe pulchra]
NINADGELSDNLRDHYPSCPQRQDQTIPEAARGGRRSHACDSCTTMKLGCDGKSPCNTCQQKKLECKYFRLRSKGLCVKTDRRFAETCILLTNLGILGQEGDMHRGSINFLLNAGTNSFFDCFQFPSSGEQPNPYTHGHQQPAADITDHYSGSESGSYESDLVNWASEGNYNFLNFMSSPFSNFPSEISPTTQIALRDWEPPSVQSSAIIQCIRDRAIMIYANPQQQSEMDQNLNYLFTPSKIIRFVNEAFESWHPNYPIIHIPSFSIETASIPLLIVITVMGALYSRNETEVNSARSILDLVEYYIFSLDDLTDEHEIRQIMMSGNLHESPFCLSSLQAAYIMVVLQFWTGSSVSKKRTIESRFTNVTRVARRLRLVHARHDQSDLISEALWIEKECQIRLINFIYHFDCALTFFAHFPHRLTLTEMNFDLMCEDQLFFSHHPFSEPHFSLGRNLTLLAAFQSLFIKVPPIPGIGTDGNPCGFNTADMFTLIHLLFVYVHNQMTMYIQPFRFVPSEGSLGQNSEMDNKSDTNIEILKAALEYWHTIWTSIRSNTCSSTEVNESLCKNAINYWMITQLILTNPKSADTLMAMEIGCED